MKIQHSLLESGVLQRGEVRHCATWDFRDPREETKIAFMSSLRRYAHPGRRPSGSKERLRRLMVRLFG